MAGLNSERSGPGLGGSASGVPIGDHGFVGVALLIGVVGVDVVDAYI